MCSINNKFYEIRRKTLSFFNLYRAHLTEEILAYDAYSEFMITFPDFISMKRNDA